MNKDLLTIADLTAGEFEEILNLAGRIKKDGQVFSRNLRGKFLGLVFQKPSTRTRVSFEVGIGQLGGQAIYLGPADIKLGVREETRDIARTLARYLNVIVARTFSHEDVTALAQHANIPVINGLSDRFHPCQAISDVLTIKEKKGDLKGRTLAYLGDGNNVLHSLLLSAGLTGLNLRTATPVGYEPSREIASQAHEFAQNSGAVIFLGHDPDEAVRDADIVYTDVWTSMGQETEYEKRREVFRPYQVNSELLKQAAPDVLVMHCLPAHRGDEITDKVMESDKSIIFDQAENRLHAQKAILLKLLEGEKY